MLTNPIEIGTARLTTRRVTLTARTAVSPRATPNSSAGPGTPSAPARRPSRFPALACVLALAALATPALAQTDATATNTSTVPGPPTRFVATAGGITKINLSWSAPASDGGDPIIGYKIEVSSDTGASWTDLVANTGDANTTYSHTGLAAGTTRHYRVSAINSNGTGDASNVANATSFITRPGAPTGLTATASWTTQINLSWTAPVNDGGSAITTYVIDVSPDGITNWRYRAGNVNADTTYSQIGLAPGTTRHYRVVAINADGWGPNSNIASATTGQATVTFGASSYTAVEGRAGATVEVQLSAALSAPVTIPLEVTLQGGATAADYAGIPETVTFGADQTAVTFTVTATADTDAETGESVSIEFGTLPEGVFARSSATATVTLADRRGPDTGDDGTGDDGTGDDGTGDDGTGDDGTGDDGTGDDGTGDDGTGDDGTGDDGTGDDGTGDDGTGDDGTGDDGTPGNTAPLAVDDAAETPEDTPVTIAVLANDSDPDGDTLAVVEASAPAHGSAVVADAGTVTYTPEPDFNGSDRFTYTVGDGSGLTARAAVKVTVLPVNDPPLPLDDAAETPEDTPVTVLTGERPATAARRRGRNARGHAGDHRRTRQRP